MATKVTKMTPAVRNLAYHNCFRLQPDAASWEKHDLSSFTQFDLRSIRLGPIYGTSYACLLMANIAYQF